MTHRIVTDREITWDERDFPPEPPSEDAIVERLVKRLSRWGYASDEVRDFNATQWENELFSLNLLQYGYTDAMCARVIARLLAQEIEWRSE